MLSALGCLILLDAGGKWLGMRGFPVAATAWSRYAGHLIVVLGIFLPSRGLAVLRTDSPGRQAVRGILMVAITLLYFAALPAIPLAQATAIFFTTPMMVTVLATVFLRERPGLFTWLAVGLGFLGVLVAVRPGIQMPLSAALLVLTAAAGNAIYQTMTRAQSQADPPEVQVLYAGLAGAAVMTLAMPLWWTSQWWARADYTAFDWTVFSLMGVFGSMGHLLLARAFKLAPASRLTPWSYTQLLWAVLLGWLAFGDTPDGITLIGMALIAFSPHLTWLSRRGRGH